MSACDSSLPSLRQETQSSELRLLLARRYEDNGVIRKPQEAVYGDPNLRSPSQHAGLAERPRHSAFDIGGADKRRVHRAFEMHDHFCDRVGVPDAKATLIDPLLKDGGEQRRHDLAHGHADPMEERGVACGKQWFGWSDQSATTAVNGPSAATSSPATLCA